MILLRLNFVFFFIKIFKLNLISKVENMPCNFFYCQPRVLTSRLDHKMPIPAHKTTIQTLPPKFKKHKTQEKEEPENSMDDYG